MNYLMLGQAFKFYEFQPESMRNTIAKSFSDLYSETHEVDKRISPRRLRLAYDHIKDFRNICRMTNVYSAPGCLRLAMSI